VEVAGVQERTNEILATLAQRQIATEEAAGRESQNPNGKAGNH